MTPGSRIGMNEGRSNIKACRYERQDCHDPPGSQPAYRHRTLAHRFPLGPDGNKNKSVGSPISFDIRLGIYTLNSLRRDPVEPRVTPHSSGN